MEPITELTPEQEDQLEVYRDKWSKIGLSCTPVNRDVAEAKVRELYELEGYECPPISWYPSPYAAAEQIRKDGEESPQLAACFGQHSAGWLAFYDYIFEVLGVPEDKAMKAHIALAEVCGWFYVYKEHAYLCEKTTAAEVDADGRLHCLTGPALAYSDGHEVYAVRGITVPRKVVMAPDTITAQEVLDERNAEVRRVMLDQMGHDKFMEQANAQVLDSDTDELGHPRRLLKVALEDDEDIVVVQVVNSTPEPDGSDKIYQLRVPPTFGEMAVTNPGDAIKAALAWTFSMEARDYKLDAQS